MEDPRVDSPTTPFRVSLEEQPLAEFLASAAGRNVPGLIEAATDASLVRIFLHGDDIRLVSSGDPNEHIGSVLHREGVIDALTRNRAIARVAEGRLNEAEILTDEGVDASRVRQALHDLALQIIGRIFDWTEGTVNFQPGPEMPASNMGVALSVPQAIRRGVLEIRDARRLVDRMGGRKALVSRSEEVTIEPEGDDERRLLDRLSSRITLFELVKTPPLAQADNARVLYGLFVMGCVRIKQARQIKVQLRRNQ